MKIVVTGAAGFVGKYLVELLQTSGQDEIIGLDYAQADITNYPSLKKFLAKIQPDQVYHLAGFASGAGKDKALIFKVNVGGTLNILRALQDIGRPAKVLLTSTAYVYGSTSICADEKAPIDAKSFYDKSKIEMENQSKEFLSHNLQIVITRATNHTGPGQRLGFVVPDLASQIAKAKDGNEILTGNLNAKRDIFDVRDCVNAYKLIMKKGESGEIYNIGRGTSITIKEVLDKLIKISGKNIIHKISPEKMRPSDITQNCVNSAKVCALGWKPKYDLDQTLEDTYKYWESQNYD